jgi:uncharacterized protein (DUF697 family)
MSIADQERARAARIGTEIINWMATHHGDTMPKDTANALTFAMAIVLQLCFKDDRDEMEKAFKRMDKDLRDTVREFITLNTVGNA